MDPSQAPLMHALEQAAFAAWPAACSQSVAGWLLRLDVGYTKRANSLNATQAARELSATDLSTLEQTFIAKGLPPVVRTTSLVSLPGTEALLTQRGYQYSGASWVLHRALAAPFGGVPEVRLEAGAAPWMQVFSRLAEQRTDHAAAHLALLQRITHRTAWATLGEPSSPSCCGLGVLVGEHLGLFDILTGVASQRQGLAERLCGGLLAWGQAQGAREAFLQVVKTNAPALALYEKLGFNQAYEYGYWVQA